MPSSVEDHSTLCLTKHALNAVLATHKADPNKTPSRPMRAKESSLSVEGSKNRTVAISSIKVDSSTSVN
jgi:hypothetical protein